jgi:hypothetical protein
MTTEEIIEEILSSKVEVKITKDTDLSEFSKKYLKILENRFIH